MVARAAMMSLRLPGQAVPSWMMRRLARPRGWRHQAHLTVLGAGWVSPTTANIRATAPWDRLGGVDGNVSNIAIASLPAPGTDAEPVLLTSHVTISPEQKA